MNKINRGEENRRANKMEEICKSILGKNYYRLKEYFETIMQDEYDCMVFISRRCYILFLIFVCIEKWSASAVVCTDLGIFPLRKKLKECKRIIVIDDIGYSGVSLCGVLEKINLYLSSGCVIDAALFAICRDSFKRFSKITLNEKVKVKTRIYCQLTETQCQELSFDLVSVILAAGVPYSTFVYSINGIRKKEFASAEYPIQTPLFEKMELDKYKWKTQYLDTNRISLLQSLCDYQCVRLYKKQDDDLVYVLPFLFMKEVKAESIPYLYQKIAEVFLSLGCCDLAEEIRDSLSVKKEWRKEAIEYIACMISAFCSKALSELIHLNGYMDEVENENWNSLSGSFSACFIEVLKKCDKDFAIKFFEMFSTQIGNKDFFVSRSDALKYAYHHELRKFVAERSRNNVNVYSMLCDIFKWMREKSKECPEQMAVKTISVSDLVTILKEEGSYKEEDIYIAQIECWDRGIATYRFCFIEDIGITAVCSIGEMSASIDGLRYQSIIREYYKVVALSKNSLNLKQRRKVLHTILMNSEETKNDLTKRQEVLELFDEKRGSLYDMLL